MKFKTSILSILMFVLSLNAFGVELRWKSPIEFTPAAPKAGNLVKFKAMFKAGDEAADNIKVILKIDNQLVGTQVTPHLDSDQLEWATFNWSAKAGAHNVKMILDPDNTIAEVNETNNVKTTQITVGSSGGNLIIKGPVNIKKKMTLKKVPEGMTSICPGKPDVKAGPVTVKYLGMNYAILGFTVHHMTNGCVKQLKVSAVDSNNQLLAQETFKPQPGKTILLKGFTLKEFTITIKRSEINNKYVLCIDPPADGEAEMLAEYAEQYRHCSRVRILLDPYNFIDEANELNNQSEAVKIEWIQ